jgi:hypothetical protein
MRSGYNNAINIPISIKIPIKVVKVFVAAKVKEEKLKIFAFWRSLKSSLALILGVILIIGSLPALSAYEAHVVNVTATIQSPVPLRSFSLASNSLSNSDSNLTIDPSAGAFCNDKSIEVSLSTTLPDAQIIYTLDGFDPVCGTNGYVYDKTFFLTESTTVKASTCTFDQQGEIYLWDFEMSEDNCNTDSAIAGESISVPPEDTVSPIQDSGADFEQGDESQGGEQGVDGEQTQTPPPAENPVTQGNSEPEQNLSPAQQPLIEPSPAIEPQPAEPAAEPAPAPELPSAPETPPAESPVSTAN